MQIITPSGAVIEGDATLSALKADSRWCEADGFYFYSGRSGALTGVAAAGHLFGFRNNYGYSSSNTLVPVKALVVDRIAVKAVITTPFTTAQEWGLEAMRSSAFTAFYTAGFTAVTYTTGAATRDQLKKRYSYPPTLSAQISIASTGAMTGHTFLNTDVSEFASDMAWELAAGAAVPRSRVAFEKDYTTGVDCPLILMPNEGFAVRNVVLMGAAGVMRLAVEMAWHEVDSCDL